MKRYISSFLFISISITIYLLMVKKESCFKTNEGINLCSITIQDKPYYVTKSCLDHNCIIKECKEYTYIAFSKENINYSIPMCFNKQNGIEVELFKLKKFQFD